MQTELSISLDQIIVEKIGLDPNRVFKNTICIKFLNVLLRFVSITINENYIQSINQFIST